MIRVPLLTRRGEPVCAVRVPAFDVPPEAIRWGARYFVRREDGSYREAMCWFVPADDAEPAGGG